MDASVVTCATCRTKNEIDYEATQAPRCAQCQAFLPWVTSATDATFRAISNSDQIVVCVSFWGTFAPASRILAPALERLAAERAGQLKLVWVDVEDGRRAQSKYEARMIPTTVLLWHGEEIARHIGALDLPALRHWVDQALAANVAADIPDPA
mgnify:CR=1 FL=1